MLFLDGVYVDGRRAAPEFRQVKAPSDRELARLVHTIAHRVAHLLERQGLLEADAEARYLTEHAVDENPLSPLLNASITYRIALGPQAGRKVFTLQTLPAWEDDTLDADIGKVAGFNLHAGVAAERHERKKLERLCRYIARAAVSEKRLSLTSYGNVRYHLKTPYRGGTTHVIFEPLDFLAKLVALVPRPKVNLTRFHGVLLRASCPPPCGPACGCSKSLPAILSHPTAATGRW